MSHSSESYTRTTLEPCTAIWTKQDGTHVKICNMTNSHLGNALAMLYRKALRHAAYLGKSNDWKEYTVRSFRNLDLEYAYRNGILWSKKTK